MTTTENLKTAADTLDAKADTLYLSLLAPSMKEDSLRDAANRFRSEAAKQEEAAAEYGRLARQC